MTGIFSLEDLVTRYRAELIAPATADLQALTERYIAPRAGEIVRDMYELRAEADGWFLKRLANPAGPALRPDEGAVPNAYPVSYCLEITRYMLTLMSREPAPAHMPGLQALHDFVRAGGVVKRVWGALRGGYFQNAIQVGSWYLDVANDTVNPLKPKIEFLPLADANFNNIGSYFEFARVAQVYWKCRTIPNRYFPNLAPFYPAITFEKNGAVRFDSRNSFMFPMNIAKRFAPARDYVLGEAPAGDALVPYIGWLERYAASDTRCLERDHPMWFHRAGADELDAGFQALAAQDIPSLTRAAERALGPDTHFLHFPDIGGADLPHRKETVA